MREELENPMVLGDYYDSAPEAGYPEKLGWVMDRGLGYKAAAVGLRVDRYAIDGIRDQLEAAFELFLERKPDDVRGWVEKLLELDPYHDAFSEWWKEQRTLDSLETIIPRRDEEGHAVFPAGFDDDWGEYGRGEPA